MGNSMWCSASGERLVTAARDGDAEEARALLERDPGLAAYSTFAASNSPLHFAASKGHSEIVRLLLEHGTDANSRNFCSQTALMLACRRGHWEVVLTLLIFKSNVTKAEYLSGKTALHYAAYGGHIRCIRLLAAEFVPSTLCRAQAASRGSNKENRSALSKFVNKVADGGVTALHLAALNGHSECLQMLLDLHADVSAATYHNGSSMRITGAGSTPLHFAASGGNLKCCEILLAKGSCRLTLNCDGWLPVDVARLLGHRHLMPLLSPNSDSKIATSSPSCYLSLPLSSIINIARDYGLQSVVASSDDSDVCAICLERACTVAAEGCKHELCVKCALYLCTASNVTSQTGPPGSIACPLCRNGIVSFVRLPRTSQEEAETDQIQRICSHPRSLDPLAVNCRPEFCNNSAPVSP